MVFSSPVAGKIFPPLVVVILCILTESKLKVTDLEYNDAE